MTRVHPVALAGLALAAVVASSMWVGRRPDPALVTLAEAVCGAVQAGDLDRALVASDRPPTLGSEAGRQIVECRCWALHRAGRSGECDALLDARLAPSPGDSPWLPPPPLLRGVVQARLDRGDLDAAFDLARRGSDAHPTSLHLLSLRLESQAARDGDARAISDFGAWIAERAASGADPHAFEARVVLAMAVLRRGDASAALDALGDRVPPRLHPQLSAWLHNRVAAQAAAGDLGAVQRTMTVWRELGTAPEAELAARYAVALSMAGLRDPEHDFVALLRDAARHRDAIADPLIVSWVYQRLVAHLLADGLPEEALAAWDEGSAGGPLPGITRGEIVRAVARPEVGDGPASDRRGRLSFRLPAEAGPGTLRIAPDADRAPDADYRVYPLARGGEAVVERTLSHWPVRWVYSDASGDVVASGRVWPEPQQTVVVRVAPGPASERVPAAVPSRRPGDQRRRVIVVILDCADWRLVGYLRARGELPSIEGFFARGRRAVLRSDPPLTAAAMEALVWPGRVDQTSVVAFLHRMGLELGGLEGVGSNPLGFLGALLPGSESLFDVIGRSDRVVANMLFSHGAIDAGHHAELIGPHGLRRDLAVTHVQRPLSTLEREMMSGVIEVPRYRPLAERIAGEFDAALEIVRAGEVDLLMLRVEALDLLTHSLFSALYETGQDDGDADLLDVYRYLDWRLGFLENGLDADDVLVVMSDHGIRNAMEHESDAIWVAVGGDIAAGRAEARPDLAVVPGTLAALLGLETGWPAARTLTAEGPVHARR